MKVRIPGPMTSALLLVGAGVLVGTVATRRSPSAKTPLSGCDGEYSDSLGQFSPRLREIEQGPRSRYTYLVRSTAKYECPYFGPDGKLKRRHVEATEHGTAFAYEVSGNDTYLLTNDHVAVWPEVTDPAHHVDNVQDGCKRVDERLRIVQDERDDFEPGHIPLARIATDPQLDAAVLKASRPLAALPHRIGKSAGLRQGNAVQVRGFPLGLIHAVNTGKVVNPYDRDQEQGWNHVDFVIDALLSEGNSGSPVLALSCESGDLQLVGMYHAGYKGHSALNVVVGIDQLREFMQRKRRIPRAAPEASLMASETNRKKLRALAANALPLFDFGGLYVWVALADDAVVYHVYGKDFPVDDRRLAILEDLPTATGPGELGRLWVRAERGHRVWAAEQLGPDDQDLLLRTAEGIRTHVLSVLSFRRALSATSLPDERHRGRELLRSIERQTVPARELGNGLIDLVERLATARYPGPTNPNADAGAPPPALSFKPPPSVH